MVQLGSVFDGIDEGGPRGPDLRVSVEVPRAALGGSLHARIPPRLAHEGTLVERAGADVDEYVVLHLPPTLPAGAVLRLRGQGGIREQGQPGDLFVAVELVDRAPRPDERVEVNVVSPTLAAPSSTLTWLILLAIALAAATVVAISFG